MERWCGVLVIVAVLLGARAATGSPPTSSGPAQAGSALSAPLVAKASISPRFPGFNGPVPDAPLTTSLNGSASGGTPPYRFAWDFGEGNATSALQNPTYSYSAPSWSQLANLTVTDAAGLVATSTVSVLVLPPPCPSQAVFPWLGIVVVVVLVAGVGLLAVTVRRRGRSPPTEPPSPPVPPQ